MFKRPYLSLALNLSVWDFRLHWQEFNWHYCMRSSSLQICTFWKENLINGMMQWLIFLWMLFSLIHDVGTEQEALRQNFIQVLEGSWRKENESTVGEIPSPPLLYLLQQYIWESCATLNVETGLNSAAIQIFSCCTISPRGRRLVNRQQRPAWKGCQLCQP